MTEGRVIERLVDTKGATVGGVGGESGAVTLVARRQSHRVGAS